MQFVTYCQRREGELPQRGKRNCPGALAVKFQFVELLCSNDTERVWAVTKRTAPSTHCLRGHPRKIPIYLIGVQQKKASLVGEAFLWYQLQQNKNGTALCSAVKMQGIN